MTWRLAVLILRLVLAAVLVVVGLRAGFAAFHLHLETGLVLFGPLLLALSAFCFGMAVWLLFPRLGRPGLAFWSSIADLFSLR